MRMKMKKYLFPIVALLALAACSKVTMGDGTDTQREVSFAVANYAQTKADGGKYGIDNTFGTYAWFDNGTEVTEWMVNEPVGYAGGVWKTTEHAYFWPKTGRADFISYSPFAGEVNQRPSSPVQQGSTDSPTTDVTEEEEENPAPEPVITREVKDDKSVAYTFEYGSEDAPYRVNGSAYDLMYADLATVSSEAKGYPIVDEIKDKDDKGADSGYKGVPTLFRHALACISFQIRANFITYTDQQTGETTDWEVTLQEAALENLYHSGWRKLELGADKKWNYPGDPADSGVWRNNREVENLTLYELPTPEAGEGTGADGGQDDTQGDARAPGLPLTTDPVTLLSDYFVLPQILETSYPDNRIYAQRLRLKVHIKTLQPNGFPFTEEYNTVLDLSKLMNDAGLNNAWKMNQKFIYKISIMPTARGNEPTITPEDPSEVKIFFDPAVEGWETGELDATIML